MNRKKQPASPGPSAARFLIENIECLAIAIVMALVLKYFLIEAFKIPTGSMQPTIIGDAKIGIYDRVLVNKLSYLLGEPERWDVSVFKYPLDLSKNYIKRLIGLPGEQIQIAGGEIYVRSPLPDGGTSDQHLARKPAAVRNAVMRTVYPSPVPRCQRFEDFFSVDGAVAADGVVDFETVQGGVIQTRHTIMDHYHHGYDPAWIAGRPQAVASHAVGDLGISFTATLQEGASLAITIHESGLSHAAHVSASSAAESTWIASGPPWRGDDGSPPSAAHQQILDDLDVQIGQPVDFDFMNVDDSVILQVDGDEVGRLDYQGPMVTSDRSNKIRIEVHGGPARIENLRVRRDIYYLAKRNGGVGPGAPTQIPENRFFMMGDNTQNSWDSRYWEVAVFRDGRQEITGNWFVTRSGAARDDANPRPLGNGRQFFRDIYGEPHILPGRLAPVSSMPEPFVRREYLLGKAMAVFWPVPPFSPTFECKLLR